MRVEVTGYNNKLAIEQIVNIKLGYYQKLPPEMPQLEQGNRGDGECFCHDLLHFIHVCSQPKFSGLINIYNNSPWSILNKALAKDNTSSQKQVFQELYSQIGWQPDVVIYLFNPLHPDLLEESIYQVDNKNGVKIFTLNGAETRLKENLMMIFETVKEHYN